MIYNYPIMILPDNGWGPNDGVTDEQINHVRMQTTGNACNDQVMDEQVFISDYDGHLDHDQKVHCFC